MIKDVCSFTNSFEKYLHEIENNDLFAYSRNSVIGSLLLKNVVNDKKIILKSSNSTNPIGAAQVEYFLNNRETFKGKAVHNYIFIANTFRENAKRLTKVDKRITLIAVNAKKKEVSVLGTMNFDLNILNHFVEFSARIKFTISYDFEGFLKHEGFKSDINKPIVEVQSRTKNPKVFFSYSWDSDYHRRWVLKLASELIKSGIDVLIDEWDLEKYSNDLQLFMESGIRESDKVIMICTPSYAKKANERQGGIGIENTIITGEFYDKDKANKYLPIARLYKSNLHECLPTYLKSQYSIDFNRDSEYPSKLDELIRKILNVPRYKKPELGNLPNLESREI
jgi:hypothetical protein